MKLILNEFQIYERDQNIVALITKFPTLFCEKPQKPESETQTNYGELLLFGAKKDLPPRVAKQMSSDSSDPNWASDE